MYAKFIYGAIDAVIVSLTDRLSLFATFHKLPTVSAYILISRDAAQHGIGISIVKRASLRLPQFLKGF